MDAKFAIRNGELIEKVKANISVYSKSNFFDFAVYSNIKVVQGKMFLPELEIDTLLDSAKAIELKHGFTKSKILEWTNELIKKNNLKDALIRLLLIGPEENNEAILFLFPLGLTFYPDKFYTKGAKMMTYKGERFMPKSKTKSLLMSYMAYKEAEKNGAIDALLIDSDNNVREGTRSSFFVIKDNILIFPPKDKVLEGVTRKIILDIAPKIMEVKEESIPLENLKEYDEHFITGTTFKVMPITQIDDIVLMESVGEKVKALQKLFKEYTDTQVLG